MEINNPPSWLFFQCKCSQAAVCPMKKTCVLHSPKPITVLIECDTLKMQLQCQGVLFGKCKQYWGFSRAFVIPSFSFLFNWLLPVPSLSLPFLLGNPALIVTVPMGNFETWCDFALSNQQELLFLKKNIDHFIITLFLQSNDKKLWTMTLACYRVKSSTSSCKEQELIIAHWFKSARKMASWEITSN